MGSRLGGADVGRETGEMGDESGPLLGGQAGTENGPGNGMYDEKQGDPIGPPPRYIRGDLGRDDSI